MALPAISCQCLTFGRTACLEEALEFFLRQDYPGPKELVIVNDLPAQRIVFDHAEVRIVNAAARFPTIGEKRNAAIRHCSGDVIVCWDDDDGFLPGHLSACAHYIEGYDYARPNRCFVWADNSRIERTSGSYIAQHVFTREVFERVGGYARMNSGQDMDLDNRLRRVARCNWPEIDAREITYLFRWANGEYHLSGFGRDRPGVTSGYSRIGEWVSCAVAEGRVPSGEVRLVPQFRQDYGCMVRRFVEEHSPISGVQESRDIDVRSRGEAAFGMQLRRGGGGTRELEELVTGSALPWTEWTISRALAMELVASLERRQPRRILELGSGASTAILAAHARARGGAVLSLEHDRRYHRRTEQLLAELGLERFVRVLLAPIADRTCADGQARPWYSVVLDGTFDFVFADGPPMSVGRDATLFALWPYLESDWELWLDDANRRHERACIELWQRYFPVSGEVRQVDDRGLAILRRSDRPSQVDLEGTGPNSAAGISHDGLPSSSTH